MTISPLLGRPLRHCFAFPASVAAALGAVIAMAPASALAEVKVSGHPNAVRIEAQTASVDEIFAALRNSFGLRHHSRIKLDGEITGNYEGSLRTVLTRILGRYDFVLKTVDGAIEIDVLGLWRPSDAAAVSPGSPASKLSRALPASQVKMTKLPDGPKPVPVASAGGPVPVAQTPGSDLSLPVPVQTPVNAPYPQLSVAPPRTVCGALNPCLDGSAPSAK